MIKYGDIFEPLSITQQSFISSLKNLRDPSRQAIVILIVSDVLMNLYFMLLLPFMKNLVSYSC